MLRPFSGISLTSGQREGDNEKYMQWNPGQEDLPSARNQILTAGLANQRLSY